MVEILREIGPYFSSDAYLTWTRVQCVLWTAADVVIVVVLLLMANRVRTAVGVRPHVYSFILVALTVCLVPFVILASTGRLVFLLELLVTVPHFLLILYVLLADRKYFIHIATEVLPNRVPNQPE